MPRTRGRGTGSGRKRRNTRPPPRRRRARTFLGLALLGLAVAAFVWWRQEHRPTQLSQAPSDWLRLDAAEADRTAIRLARAGRHLEAIPYFRTVLRLEPRAFSAHENLASSLGNGAQQGRNHLGKTDNAVRSSVERIGMLQELLSETVMAERLATTPEGRILALTERGRALESWGFPLDALVQFQAAHAVAPNRADVQKGVLRVERELAGAR